MSERRSGRRKIPGIEGTTNQANNRADRPGVHLADVNGPGGRIVSETVVPPIDFSVVSGHTIGGGTSTEALRRARRK